MHRLPLVIALIFACTKDEPLLPAPAPPPAPEASSVPVTDAMVVVADSGADAGPPRPLQAWMKTNMTPAMNAKDFDLLGANLDTIMTFAPKEPGYGNWVSIAKDGKNAAKSADLGAVRAACRGCHEQYKSKYKTELRARPIPP